MAIYSDNKGRIFRSISFLIIISTLLTVNLRKKNMINLSVEDVISMDFTKDEVDYDPSLLAILDSTHSSYKFLSDGTIYLNRLSVGNRYDINYLFNNQELQELNNLSPSIDDLFIALENNTKIPQEFKGWIKEYILSLKENNPQTNLISFYLNLKDLEICVDDEEEITNATRVATVAYFEANSKTIHIPNKPFYTDEDKYTFIHELSHMLNNYISKNETILHTSVNFKINELPIPVLNENGLSINYLGVGYTEGLNDLITYKNTSKYPGLNFYTELSDVVDLFSDILDIDVQTMNDNGIIYVLEKLKEFGISKPTELFLKMDNYYNFDLEYIADSKMHEEIYLEIYSTLVNNLINKGYDEDYIYSFVLDKLDNSFIERMMNENNINYSSMAIRELSLKDKVIKEVSNIMVNHGFNELSNYYDGVAKYKDNLKFFNQDRQIFVYEDLEGRINACYVEFDEYENVVYYSLNNNFYIDESLIKCGDSLENLVKNGIVDYKIIDYNLHVNYTDETWNNYFEENISRVREY